MKPMHRTRARATRSATARRAFTLWEMLLTLIVFAAAMNVATRLIHQTIRSCNQTAAASSTLTTQRQWLDLLRRDAWSAGSRTISDGQLTLGGPRPIVWRQEADRLARDGPDGEIRSWPIDARQLQWSVRKNGLLELSDGEVTIALASPAATGSAGEP
jgi:type II secretory pathway pseudopilin PulG